MRLIYDRRAPGDTPVYYYLPGVSVGLDRIDLAAGAMPPEELKGANCPGAESDEKAADPAPVAPILPPPPAAASPTGGGVPALYLVFAIIVVMLVLAGGMVFLRRG